MVLATFKILLYALALNFKLLNALFNKALLLSSKTQYFSINFGVSSLFETISKFLYLSICIFLALLTLFLICSEVSIFSVFSSFSYFIGCTSTCISILSNNGPTNSIYIICYTLW